MNPTEDFLENSKIYQLYSKLARPTLSWVGVIGAAYGVIIGPIMSRPLDSNNLAISLGFSAVLFGLRGVEKINGVA